MPLERYNPGQGHAFEVELVDNPFVSRYIPLFPSGTSRYGETDASAKMPPERNNDESIFKMHVWRLVLVLLLSVAVPAYGLGAVGRHDGCPVQAHVAGAEKTATASSCCDDMGGHEHNSNDACAKLCSLGGDCRNANLLQTSIDHEPSVTLHASVSPGAFVHISSFDPSGAWRPPRSF